MNRPVLVEGPAGSGRPSWPRCWPRRRAPLFRLQCYEGLDEAKALYEWEYAQAAAVHADPQDKIGELIAGRADAAPRPRPHRRQEDAFFSERFLLAPARCSRRVSPTSPPCCSSTRSTRRSRVRGVPARGAGRLRGDHSGARHDPGARTCPRVVLTSNNARELTDALKRRCLHLHIDFPDRERELASSGSGCPRVGAARPQVVARWSASAGWS